MRSKVIFALLLLFGLGLPQCHPQASPYSNSVFPSQVFTHTGQTGNVIQLNGLVNPSTVGSSFASLTITVTGTSLTTATFAIQGSSDNGVTFFPLPIYAVASPTSPPTPTVNATANGLYQVNSAGLTHVRAVTSGTFTATTLNLTFTGSPNALVSRSNSGSGGGATTPATLLLYKGTNVVNGVTPAAPGTDYVIPSGTVATAGAAGALLGTPHQCSGSTPVAAGINPNGDANCIAAAGGGATLPTNAPVFGLTATTSRASVFTDYVPLWNASGSCVGFLKNDGTCATAIASFPGTTNQAIASNGGGTAFASKATFDTPGNFKSLSNDGLVNAFLNQTNPTSNDGIHNALQSTNSLVNAGPDYASVEATVAGGTYRSPLGSFFGTQASSPGWAEATALIDDRRPGNLGSMFYMTPPGGTAFVNTKVLYDHVDNVGGSGQTWNTFEDDYILCCSGKNQQILGIMGPDSHVRHNDFMYVAASGIANWDTLEATMIANGDFHPHQTIVHCNGANPDGSKEGCQPFRNQVDQTNSTWIGHASATVGPGSLQIQGTTDSGVNPSRGDGQVEIDLSQGTSDFLILTTTAPNNPTPGIWTTDATWTIDNMGRYSAALNNSASTQQYNGLTTSNTFTVTGLPSALVMPNLCVSSPDNTETAAITALGAFSGGTQSVTVNLRNYHQANGWVSQGPNACKGARIEANDNGALFQMYRILGAFGPHSIYYTQTYAGTWVGGPGGSFNTLQIPAGTMSRDAAGIVTMVLGFPDTQGQFQGDGIHVLGSVIGTYNGAFCCVQEQIGLSTTTLTWPTGVTGAAGSTTTAQNIQLIANGVPSNQAALYPMTVVTYAGDIALHSYTANGNNSVEALNFTVNNGDQIFTEPNTAVVIGLEHDNVIYVTPGAAANEVNVLDYFIGGRNPDNVRFWSIVFQDDPRAYLGAGGTKGVSAVLLNMNTASTLPFLDIFNLIAPTDAVLNIRGCGPYGCSASNANYDIIRAVGNHNEFEMNWALAANTLDFHISGTAHWKMSPNQSIFLAQGTTGSDGSVVTLDGDAGIKLNVSNASNNNSNFVVREPGVSFDRPITISTANDQDPTVANLGTYYGEDATFNGGKFWRMIAAASAGDHGVLAGHWGLYDQTDDFIALDCTSTGCKIGGTLTAGSAQFDGSTNGFFGLTAIGVAPGAAPANTIQFEAPNSVTAYSVRFPSAQGTGGLTNDGAGNLSWTLVPWSCQPGYGDGLNAISAGTYLQTSCYNDTGKTVTLTGIKCFTNNSGTSTMNVTNGTGSGLLTGAITCTSSFATGTQSGTVTIAAGDFAEFTFVADGVTKQANFVMTGVHP